MSYCRIIFKVLLLLLTTPGIAIHTQAEVHAPLEFFEEKLDAYAQMQRGLPITYDGFLKLLDDLENDELEKRYDFNDLDQINHFLANLARQGLLPSDDASELETDIEELLSDHNYPEFSFGTGYQYSIVPACAYYPIQVVPCKSFIQKGWNKTKKWAKKHKKPLIIIAAVGAAAAITVGIVAAVAASAAAGAASAQGDSSDHKNKHKETKEPKSIPFPSPEGSEKTSLIQSILDTEIISFKEMLDREQFLNPQDMDFSIEESGKILGQAFAYQSLEAFQKQASLNPQFYKELQEIGGVSNARSSELTFSTDGNLYQLRGERALELRSYDQAIFDFSKVLEQNPNHPDAYLDRAFAHLHKGNYLEALEDHQVHLLQKPLPSSQLIKFTQAFARGLDNGVNESEAGLVSFAGDVLIHPIDTAREMWDGCSAFADLILNMEWAIIGKVLSPELHGLFSKWGALSIDERGELAAHAFGKIGTDILAPAAAVKVFSIGFKGAKELAVACKTLKNAEKTLALETLAYNSLGITEFTPQLSSSERSVIASKELSTARSERNLRESARINPTATTKSLESILEEKGIMTDKTVKAIEGFLGGEGRIITNTDGDIILMRGDKKIRFDIKDPHGDNPHFHLEKKNPNGEWVDATQEHRYYFTKE